MASKTIIADLISFPGATDLTLHLATESSPDTTLNGAGTLCTLSGTTVQSAVVTQNLATYGILVARYKRGSVVVATGFVYIPGDIAGNYPVGSFTSQFIAAQNYSYLPPQMRSTGDTQPLRFQWPVSGATFVNCTKEINSDAPVAIPSNSFEFLRTITRGANVYHIYQMLYNAADRPLTEGSVMYRISDGTNERNLQLNVISLNGTNGLHTITVTVQDSSAAAVVGATVVVKNSDQSRTLGWGTTNASGQIVFHLNAGTYKVIVQPLTSQYGTLATQTLVVTTSASVTYTLTVQALDPPLTPGLATVRFLVLDNGTAVSGAKVSVELEDDNPTVSTALISRVKHSGTTNGSGIVDLVMIHEASFTRGGVYRVQVSDASGRRLHNRRVTVPSFATLYAEELDDA